ncbi:MAG TPA: S8 family serine peptidase [Trebonia sp.]
MTLRSSFWLTRGTLPLLAALAAAPAFASAAIAQVSAPVSVTRALLHAAPPPNRGAEWWLGALKTQQAWGAAPEEGAGVTVAVLSTGVAPGEQDLAGNVIAGPDYTGSGRSQGGPFWGAEGTAVASLIAGHGHGPGGQPAPAGRSAGAGWPGKHNQGSTTGTEGITGVAPLARILSVRVTLEYNDPEDGDAAVTRHLPDAIARGIQYAVAHGAKVIALPLDPGWLGPAGGSSPAAGGSPAEQAAVRDALAHNVVLVAPAGDDAMAHGATNYPAAYPGVIAAGATASNGKPANFSSTRPYVALTAPGVGLAVAAPDGYATLSTTDLSAALTAGVAALVRSRYPELTAAQITLSLEEGATPANPEAPGTGNGALNAAGTLNSAASIFSLIGNPMPNSAPTSGNDMRNRQRASATGDSGQLASSALRDAAAVAGALVVVLVMILVLARRRRRPEFRAKPRMDGSPRRGRSARGSHARGNARAKLPAAPIPPTSAVPALPVSNSDSAASRANVVDALIGGDPAAIHPPWEVAHRLSAPRQSGPFPRVPPPDSAPFPRMPPPDSGPFPHVPLRDPDALPRVPSHDSDPFPRLPAAPGRQPPAETPRRPRSFGHG